MILKRPVFAQFPGGLAAWDGNSIRLGQCSSLCIAARLGLRFRSGNYGVFMKIRADENGATRTKKIPPAWREFEVFAYMALNRGVKAVASTSSWS